MQVVRWGRSAYETDEALALERDGLAALGMTLRFEPRDEAPNLDGTDALVVTSGVRVDADVISRFPPCLGVVVTTTSGHDHLDLVALGRAGVVAARLPLARRDAVVEFTIAEMLVHLRRLEPLVGAARAGRWARGDLAALHPRGLSGRRVTVVGRGVIGAQVSTVLGAFGAIVTCVDPKLSRGPTLADALPSSDVLTLHCALTPTSRGLVDGGALDQLPPHAVVINTARGAVLDLPAALSRVREGGIGGLTVDVFAREPWPTLGADAATPGVRLTPHAAGFTADLGRNVAGGVIDTLRAWRDERTVPFAAAD